MLNKNRYIIFIICFLPAVYAYSGDLKNGLLEENYPKAIAIASKGWESRINSICEEFYTKNVPAGKEDTYGDAWQRFLKTQDNK